MVTRDDLQKPPVRMWLFGMVTMIELRYTRLIAGTVPRVRVWREFLSEGRLKKAEELMAERSRRNRSVGLLDCLQLSDKGQIVARNESIRGRTIFTSRRQAEDGIDCWKDCGTTSPTRRTSCPPTGRRSCSWRATWTGSSTRGLGARRSNTAGRGGPPDRTRGARRMVGPDGQPDSGRRTV